VRRIVNFTARATPDVRVPLALATVAREAAGRLRQRGVRVEVEVSGEARVWASPSCLEPALQAVLDNAVEAMPPDGVLRLLSRAQGGSAALQVCDSGQGLSPEARAHLFEPFWTSTPAHHLGLGLALARELLQAQGGRLEVDSRHGQGTTATLWLPAVEEALAPDLRSPHHPALGTPHLAALCSS
jgi:signal transduction histidine kinase